MKVTIFIPTLNEIDGMRAIMPRIKEEWYDQLLVVDGHSTDGTIEYCKENGYELLLQKQKGLRYAYSEALDHIKGDVMITFSPDGNSIPELIPEIIAKLKEGNDMVIASRYKGAAKSEDDDPVTGFGNRVFNFLINTLHGGHYTDAMVIYRGYPKKVYTDLDLHLDKSYETEERMFGTKVGIEVLLSIRFAKRKLKLAEIPGDEPPRIGGERKLQVVRWGAAYMFEVFREVFIWK